MQIINNNRIIVLVITGICSTCMMCSVITFLLMLSCLILKTTLLGRLCYFPHFRNREDKKFEVTEVHEAKLGLDLGPSDL